MKGGYVEEENDNNNTTHHNMFAKLSHHHHHPKFQPPPTPLQQQQQQQQQQQRFPPPHLHSQLFSQEADSPPPPPPHLQPPSSSKKPKTTPPSTTTTTTSNEDVSGTIEVSRRLRGRPPGSKNKPKPPVIITREPEPAMSPYILELPSGADVVDSLTRFTRRRSVGLCVLTASGAVANITLKQPSTTTPGGTVTFHGRFHILSLSAVVVNTVPFGGSGGFTISLAGPQGQIVGGKVVGSLVCSGTVYVIAASFNNPTYSRLPLDENHHQQQQQDNQAHNSNQNPENSNANPENSNNSPASGGGTMSLYSGHLGSTAATTTEGIWTPPSSSRQPY